MARVHPPAVARAVNPGSAGGLGGKEKVTTSPRHDRTDLPSLVVIGVNDIPPLDVDGSGGVASQAPITAVAGADRKNLPVFLVINVDYRPALNGITNRHLVIPLVS